MIFISGGPIISGLLLGKSEIWLRKYMYGWKASVTIFSSWGCRLARVHTHTHTKARTQHINPLHNIHKYIELLCAFFITRAWSSSFNFLFCPFSSFTFSPYSPLPWINQQHHHLHRIIQAPTHSSTR